MNRWFLSSRLPIGWLQALALAMAVGLAFIAWACTGSRAQAGWALPVFWLGFLILIIPAGVRLCMTSTPRAERIGILAMLAVSYYLIKVLYSPLFFTFNDELQHMRSMDNLLQTHALFQPNPTLNVSPYFPGLENVTDALVSMTGLPVFPSGLIVIGAAYILMPVVLFLLYECISQSAYIAGLASLIFFANPSFLLGYAQFAYEPLALSLAYFVLYLLARLIQPSDRPGAFPLGLMIGLFLSSVILTHHITSYYLALILCVWAAIAFFRNRPFENRTILVVFALLTVAGCAAWLFAGNPSLTWGYITTPLQGAFNGMRELLLGGAQPRRFFSGQGGKPPLLMKLFSYLSVLLIVASLPLGLLALLRRKAQATSLALTLGLLSLGYLVAQGLRLSAAGLPITNRLAAPTFLALSFVIVTGVLYFLSTRFTNFLGRWRQAALIGWLCIINIGAASAIIADRQLPGPFNADVFTRAIEPLGIHTAQWTEEMLGPNQKFGADFINMLIFGSYGSQHVVTQENGFFPETSLFKSSDFGVLQKDYLREHGVEYLVIDDRRKNQYVLDPPPTTSDPTDLTILDNQPQVSRVIDSGGIIVYHLGFVSPGIKIQPGQGGGR